ncbi:TetR/AcrR family transcriptional regulator [Solitalea koreensis]|uniref:Transcriptional regulator, TetR family n=1 Tax=Solitalea koreensis TaxID=543615 RepID=A0A521DNN7_9SPHI|nr:TetR family transcriptional regulator [Solitalea koreensis]SMO73316.1 transcriptional regulator, TetR family [Solitalea koreensis]
MTTDISAEEKIKEAARKLFTQKGYAAVKTRDIATEAGINLALLNYYFRSKEKLFEMIMVENIQNFIKGIFGILNKEDTSIETKFEELTSTYIDMLAEQPNLPSFIFNVVREKPDLLLEKLEANSIITNSYFLKQFKAAMEKGEINSSISPIHLLLNFVGLTVFPFIGKPIIQARSGLDQKQFLALMEERKKLIPMWIKTMLKPTN